MEILHTDLSRKSRGLSNRSLKTAGETAENLHRDTDEKDLTEDRWDNRKWRFHIGKREREREEKLSLIHI